MESGEGGREKGEGVRGGGKSKKIKDLERKEKNAPQRNFRTYIYNIILALGEKMIG